VDSWLVGCDVVGVVLEGTGLLKIGVDDVVLVGTR
jgi:hypothetical protein